MKHLKAKQILKKRHKVIKFIMKNSYNDFVYVEYTDSSLSHLQKMKKFLVKKMSLSKTGIKRRYMTSKRTEAIYQSVTGS